MRANRPHSGDTIPALFFLDREKGSQSWSIWIERCGIIYFRGFDWQELLEAGNRGSRDVKVGGNFYLNHTRHAEAHLKPLKSGSHCTDCLGLGLCTSLPWKSGELSLSLCRELSWDEWPQGMQDLEHHWEIAITIHCQRTVPAGSQCHGHGPDWHAALQVAN